MGTWLFDEYRRRKPGPGKHLENARHDASVLDGYSVQVLEHQDRFTEQRRWVCMIDCSHVDLLSRSVWLASYQGCSPGGWRFFPCGGGGFRSITKGRFRA